MTAGVAAWGGSLTGMGKRKLQRGHKCAECILDMEMTSWEDVYTSRVAGLTNAIMADSSYPLHNAFKLLHSGRRLRQQKARTKRFMSSSVSSANSMSQ